jgi:glycosyltransferase involved in cell wall biosynthesis
MRPPPSDDVCVIIPTLASRERASSLVRAIDTVVAQQGARGLPLVVVNGGRAAPEMLEHLRGRPEVRLLVLEEASLPRALQAGRARVDTPHFAVLDDDDELLPDALRIRLDVLAEAPDADAAVTNGYLEDATGRTLSIDDFGRIQAEPLRMLFVQHWLPPCAGLFRTSTVGAELFDDIPAYREWTYLALRLALARRIRFAARPTFVYRTDTPDSLSKSRDYCLAGPPALGRMLTLPLPAEVRAALRVRLGVDQHCASSYELSHGNYRAAWRWHWRSLRQPEGWRFLPHSRHLLMGSLAALVTNGRGGAADSA